MANDTGGAFSFLSSIPAAWIASIVSAIPGVIGGLWAVWQWRAKRAEDAKHAESDSQRLERDAIRSDQATLVSTFRDDAIALRRGWQELEQARDLWTARARCWHGRALDMQTAYGVLWHLANNQAMTLAVAFSRFGVPDPGLDPLPERPPLLSPRIEDIPHDSI